MQLNEASYELNGHELKLERTLSGIAANYRGWDAEFEMRTTQDSWDLANTILRVERGSRKRDKQLADATNSEINDLRTQIEWMFGLDLEPA